MAEVHKNLNRIFVYYYPVLTGAPSRSVNVQPNYKDEPVSMLYLHLKYAWVIEQYGFRQNYPVTPEQWHPLNKAMRRLMQGVIQFQK